MVERRKRKRTERRAAAASVSTGRNRIWAANTRQRPKRRGRAAKEAELRHRCLAGATLLRIGELAQPQGPPRSSRRAHCRRHQSRMSAGADACRPRCERELKRMRMGRSTSNVSSEGAGDNAQGADVRGQHGGQAWRPRRAAAYASRPSCAYRAYYLFGVRDGSLNEPGRGGAAGLTYLSNTKKY